MSKPLFCLRLAFFSALILFFTITNGLAQTSYSLTSSVGTFTALSVGGGATDVNDIEFDDAISGNITIPFNFNYFGTTYTQFRVSSNGFITFDVGDNSFNNEYPDNKFGDPNLGKLKVAPLWDDLSGFGGAGVASYRVDGTTPDRIFIMEWKNWKWSWSASTPGISFQVKLFETSNKIQFVYHPEAGATSVPSASVGLGGPGAPDFYSLSNVLASPVFDAGGINNIGTKPADGQTYEFTPSVGGLPEPGTQASSVSGTPDLTSVVINWTSGNGTYRAVFVTTASTGTAAPVDLTSYFGNSQFGSGSQIGSTGWYCVYNGNGNSAGITGLISGTGYRFHVVEYNGLAGAQNYNTAAGSSLNPVNITTSLFAPGDPISTLTLRRQSDDQVTFNLTDKEGEKRAIFMRTASSGTSAPIDNTTYTANTVFGSGTQIGSSGWFCVFNGVSSGAITVTGLSGNTAYRVHVVDYNGPAGSERYHSSSTTGNPVQFTTFASGPSLTYTVAASSSTFTPISGVAVDDIEVDDALSAEIPIGFTFKIAGTPVTTVRASSNGTLTFNPFATSTDTGNNLSTSLNRPLVAPLWDDLSGVGGSATRATTGSAPNRVFTFQWLNWKWDYNSPSAVISFQVRLYETTNKIEYHYSQNAGSPAGTPTASIGLARPNITNADASYSFLSLSDVTASPASSTSSETSNIAVRPATNQVYSFTPVKADQTITFGTLPGKAMGDGPFALTGTSSSGLPVSYTSSNPVVAAVSGNTVTILGVGPTSITASQAGNDDYNAAPDEIRLLTVSKGDQTITFGALGTKGLIDPPFALGAISSSGLAVSYTSSNTAVATIAGDILTIVGEGTTNITASQVGDLQYNAAPDVIQPLTVNSKTSQTITFGALAAKTFGDANFALAATATSGLGVAFASSDAAIATVSGNTVTIVGAGTTDITASQVGDATYNPAVSVVQSLTVNKANQTITFNLGSGGFLLKNPGDDPITLTATASSGLPVFFSNSDPAVATLSGNTLTIVGSGVTDIGAHQLGNANYNAAPNVGVVLVVKISQTITFNALPMKTVLDGDFNLTASSSSGLPIIYFSSNGAVAVITGSLVHITGAGTTTIQATQAGSATYHAATTVEQILTVNKVGQVITFTDPGTKTIGAPPFTLAATSNSGLPVTFSTTSDKVTLSGLVGSTVTIVKAGSVTISANQAGDGAYFAAAAVNRTFCINPAKPVVTVTGLDSGVPVLTSSAAEGNQWMKEGVAIAAATNQTFTPTLAGIYTVVVSVDGCTSEASTAQTLVITGFEEDAHSLVKVYPNPVQSELMIDVSGLGSGEPSTVSMFDISGRTLETTTGNGILKMNFAPYAKGNYVVLIKNGNYLSTKRIAKN